MRRFAATVAIMGFFVLTGIALIFDVPVFDSALRGLIGAAVLYVIVKIASRLVLNIMVDAVVDSFLDSQDRESEQ